MFNVDRPAEPSNDSVRVTTQNDSTGQGTLITLDMLCGISEFDADLVAAP